MTSIFRTDLMKGKSIFITGGATGICYGISKAFLQHQAKVCIVSRKIVNIEAAIKKLQQEVPGCVVIGKSCDVRKPEEIQEAVKFCLKSFGSIDVLVNGAAGNFLASFEAMSYNAFRTVMEIDTFGTFLTSKIVYSKAMKEKGGVIINISAGLHYNGSIYQCHAGTAKAGVDALTKHLAVELGPEKIRVVGICPGPIAGTEGFSRLSRKGEFEKILPVQRYGKVEDIADCALYLASDAAGFMTGVTYLVDGGQFLSMPNFSFADQQFREKYKNSSKL